MWKTLLMIVILLGVLVACRSGSPVPTVSIFPTPIPPASPVPTLWCGYEDCTGLLPYPTATLPPPNISWTITVEGVGFTEPVTYTYQDLTQLMGQGVSHIPSAVPEWLWMPDDKNEWAGWEGVYVYRLLPDHISDASSTISSILFKTDEGRSVRLDNPWHGNAPVIALKNGEGEWLANDPDSSGPARLIILGKPLESWVYRVTQIIFE